MIRRYWQPAVRTLLVWFQLGELRRCAIGLTSDSGRWPSPPGIFVVDIAREIAGSRVNKSRLLLFVVSHSLPGQSTRHIADANRDK